MIIIDSSSAPRSMIEVFEEKYNVKVFHAWGMTEMSPMGTCGALKAGMEKLSLDKQIDIKAKKRACGLSC